MSVNNSEEEYPSPRHLEEVDNALSPRKRMRLDNSSRKSWSLMDRKTDHEVLQEMGVSLLEPDENETQTDISHHHRTLKRKHNLENLNPNVIVSPRKSPRKPCSPGGGAKHSPRTADTSKAPSETSLDSTLISDCIVDEETPLGQSAGHYIPSTCPRQPHTPSAVEESSVSRPHWEPTGTDSFDSLSDEVVLSVFRWLPKRTLAHCMLLCKKWYRVACDETLWQRLDLGNKTLSKDALGRVLARKPIILRLASSEIGPWRGGAAEPSRVQFLDLSMAAVDIATLNLLLARCPLLKKLSLESVPIDDDTCEIIGKCTQLEALNLTMSTGFSSTGLGAIFEGCTNLQSLNLGWCNLSQDSLQLVVEACPSRLLRLNLAGARLLSDELMQQLAVRCPQLRELDVSDCGRLQGGAARAARALPALQHLALSRCYLLPAASLAQLSSLPHLQCLEVWGMLQASSLAALKAALPGIQLNQFMFSAIARPTVGTRRTSIWGLRTRD